MPKVAFDIETQLSPGQVRDALIDFSEERTTIWPDLAPELYEVRELGATTALVKEGSTKPITIWALERYDWSAPGVVRWTVEDSDFCTPGSRVTASLRPNAQDGTTVHVAWMRTGTTARGRLLCRLIALTRGAPLRASMQRGSCRSPRLRDGQPSSWAARRRASMTIAITRTTAATATA